MVIINLKKNNVMYRVGVLYEGSKTKAENFNTKEQMEDFIIQTLDNPKVKKIRVRNLKTGEVYTEYINEN